MNDRTATTASDDPQWFLGDPELVTAIVHWAMSRGAIIRRDWFGLPPRAPGPDPAVYPDASDNTTGLAASQAAVALRRLGYDNRAQVSLILHLAAENGQHLTARHLVSYHGEGQDGGYAIIPASRVSRFASAVMDRKDAEEALRSLGYPEGAIRQAIEHAPWTTPEDGPAFLARHSVASASEGTYQVIDHGAAEAARLREMDGHELVRQIIARHGTDRFPTAPAQYRHTAGELGELGEAMMEWYQAAPAGELAQVTKVARGHVRKELGDLGLCVYGLATRLGENLDEAMAAVVAGEARRFAGAATDHDR